MKISQELERKFNDVCIKLTEKSKTDIFFRQRDPNVLIALAKFEQRNGAKSISFTRLKDLYAEDVKIRKVLFNVIQGIEDKLTGYIVQHLAYDYPDYHLQSKYFNLRKKSGKNEITHFKTVNKFILDLKIKHNKMVHFSKSIPQDDYFKFEEIISNLSLGDKAKMLKYSIQKYKEQVLEGFNMTSSQIEINFCIDFFIQLNKLRNKVMHHDSIIGWIWKSEKKTIDIYEFIKISTYFLPNGSKLETEELYKLKKIERMSKLNLSKLFLK